MIPLPALTRPRCRPAPRRPRSTRRLRAFYSGSLEHGSDSVPALSHEAELRAPGGAAEATESVSRADAWTGRVLVGRYRLEKRLAEGGMASVFAATHVRNGCRVAIKILHREAAAHAEVFTRFANEGAAANRVGHPAVVRVLDDDHDEDGTAFLVMELLCGETLEARWRRRGQRLTVCEVACVLYELLDALAAAHAKNVVHCDVKPANVFLTSDGHLKIFDFGIARVGGEAGACQMPLGTPAFMPPEQAIGNIRDIDARSDLWAVGATAFTLLSGRHVHDGRTPVETMLLCASSPAPALARVAPDVPPTFARIVDRALLSDKCERWPNARIMQAAVADAYREMFKRPLSRRALPDGHVMQDHESEATTAIAAAPPQTSFGEPFDAAEHAGSTDVGAAPNRGPIPPSSGSPESTLRSRTARSPTTPV